jgi:hypothetical protein
MRYRILICIATGLLLGTAWGQEASAVQPVTATPAPANQEAPKPKKAKAKHVFTNEDIPERPADASNSSSSPASTGSDASGSAAPADPKDAKAGKGQKAAKANAPKGSPEEIAAAQAKIDALKKQEDGIKNGLSTYERWSKDGDDNRRKNMAEAAQVFQNDLSETQKKRDAAQKELDDLKSPK